MNIENFFIIGDRTSKISVPLKEKWFILNKWRKKTLSFWRKKDLYSTNDGSSIFCCCFNSMGKMKYLSQVSQIQREQWLINHNPNWNSILASLFFCWFPLNEMMDQLRESKTGPHSNHWVCLFWVFACQHENFSLYGDVNSTAEELQIFSILMF